jgi:NRAMP (natural resistance-associated macrophage protein)-like metal ion transporter
MFAFAGPGYLVAVGYMDPGNWATAIAGGSGFGYTLLSVVMLANLMAIVLQSLSARLGIATGRDLAQACRDHYSPRVSFVLWVTRRTGDMRNRSGGNHRHRDCVEFTVRHSARSGRDHSPWPTCC